MRSVLQIIAIDHYDCLTKYVIVQYGLAAVMYIKSSHVYNTASMTSIIAIIADGPHTA